MIETPRQIEPESLTYKDGTDRDESSDWESSEQPVDPNFSRQDKGCTRSESPLIDISQVINNYQDQHQKFFIRNKFLRKKQVRKRYIGLRVPNLPR